MKNKSVYKYIKEQHTTEECSGFIDGYEKCQEDMAIIIQQNVILRNVKKYTEQDIRKAIILSCFATALLGVILQLLLN